jgi:Family of unknown function (DUF5972)
MHTYQRPALFVAGSFEKLTGLAALGPRETLVQPNCSKHACGAFPSTLFLAPFASRLDETPCQS